jgi:hypothetical protein
MVPFFVLHMMSKPNYYAIIPAEIRYDNGLSASEKLFYAEITALTHMNGKCYASNSYFAQLYNVANSTVSMWVSNLAKGGHIDVQYEYDGKQIVKRYISIANPVGLHQIAPSEGIQKSEGVVRKSEGGIQKIRGGYSENQKENNTLTESNTTLTESNSAHAQKQPTLEECVTTALMDGFTAKQGETYYHFRNKDGFLIARGKEGVMRPIISWRSDMAHCINKGYLERETKNPQTDKVSAPLPKNTIKFNSEGKLIYD